MKILKFFTSSLMIIFLMSSVSGTTLISSGMLAYTVAVAQEDSLSDSSDDYFSEDEFSDSEFSDDEFSDSEFSDDFSNDEFSEGEFVSADEAKTLGDEEQTSYTRLYYSIAILALTILAAVFMKFKKTRKLRLLVLLIALVIFGFYRGGPGVISSFQNTYLTAIGVEVNWQALVLFLGLIPITYFAGRVFCGWVCYLGAIQEFLYSKKFHIFQSAKAQKVMRIIRGVALTAMLIQLTFTHIILWNKVGPFKVAVNLFSPNMAGYILLGIVLISSVFMYRPFCKTLCPVGLLLGLIAKIPGASVLGVDNSCAGCKTCNDSCDINAITRKNKTSKMDNQECIRCGDCISDCKKGSISFYHKNKIHYDKITLKSDTRSHS
ncbi:MAG: 4Fe-4S binding protein [Bacteroidota bacterium]|nr:4Fe-4S binding protein [Bacteroidota bacterium]